MSDSQNTKQRSENCGAIYYRSFWCRTFGFFISGGAELLRFETLAAEYNDLKQLVQTNIYLSCIVFAVCYMLAVAFSLPIALPLTIAGGAILGWIAAPLIIVSPQWVPV